jgi:hypothetical protein
MAAGDESSVSVSFTADDADLEATLADMAESASATADKIKEAFDEMSAEVDGDLQTISTKVDELKTANFTIDGSVADNGADTKLTDIKTALDDINKDPKFAIDGSVADDGAGTKLDNVKAALDDIRKDPRFAITGSVSDNDAGTKLRNVSDALDDIRKDPKFALTGSLSDEGTVSKLDAISTALDEIRKDPTFAVTGAADDNDAGKKLDDVIAALDDIRKDPAFTITGTVEDGGAGSKLSGISADLDDIRKDPKFAVTGSVDDNGAGTKLSTVKADLDDIKRDPGFTIKGSVEDDGAGTKLGTLKAAADDLNTSDPTIRPKVSDKDDAKATTKLLALKALADSLGDKNTVINVTVKEASGRTSAALSADQIAKDVETKLDNDLSTGGGGKKKGGDLGKKVADKLSDGIGDSVVKAMEVVSLAGVAIPGVDVAAGAVAGGIAGLLTTAIGAGAFSLAVGGANNPVMNGPQGFKTKLDNILTAWDKQMAPYTKAGLDSTLAPITSWLNDAGPLVIGFSKGLTEFSSTMNTMLNTPGVKKLFDDLGADSEKSTAQLGPIIGNFLKGISQMLVEAQPLEEAVATTVASLMSSFAGAKAGQDESKFFKNAAKDFMTFAPSVGGLLKQMGGDLGQFLTDIKPLEGVALKGTSNGLMVIGQMLTGLKPVISDISWALGEVEKMPGGGELTGVATLLVASKTVRGVMKDLIAAGAEKGLDQLGGKLKSIGKIVAGTGKNSLPGAAATMQEAADEMLEAAKLMGGKGAIPPVVTDAEGAGELTLAALAPLLALAAAMAVTLSSDEGSHPTDAERALAKKDLGGDISGKAQSSIQQALAAFFQSPAGSGLEPGVKFAKGASVYTDIANNPQMAAELLSIAKAAMVSGLKDPFTIQEQIAAEKTLGLDGGKGGTFGLSKVTPKQLAEDLKNALADLPKKGKNAGEELVTSVKEGVKGKSTSAGAEAKQMADNILADVKTAFGLSGGTSAKMKTIGQNLVVSQSDGARSKLKDLTREMTTISDASLTVFNNALPSWKAAGQADMLAFIAGIGSQIGNLGSALGGVASMVPSGGGARGPATVNLTINIQSPNGTLPPQILAQVEQAVESGLSQALGAGSSALRVG